MRRLLYGMLLSLWASFAAANVPCTVPFTLTNGTIADATQVMANYNALIACLGQAAAAGSNTDITALLGLTTPLGPAGGGTNVFIGAGSSGTNTVVVNSPIPNSLTLANKFFIVFIAGVSNTGPVTLNVAGTGAKTVLNHAPSGLVPLIGGEIVATQATLAYWDGTQYQLFDASPQSLVQACTELDFAGVLAPSGYLLEDGSAISRTTFINLFGCLSFPSVTATTTASSGSISMGNSLIFQTNWYVGGNNVTCNSRITSIPDSTHIVISPAAGGSGGTTLSIGPYPQGDCSTTFTLPNASGRVAVMSDPGNVAMTNSACPAVGNIGTLCGSTSQTIAQTNLPPLSGTVTVNSNSSSIVVSAGLATFNAGGGVAFQAFNNGSATAGTQTSTGTATGIGGSTTPFLLQPVRTVQRFIKF